MRASAHSPVYSFAVTGLSLPEVLVVLSIATIVLSYALPGLQGTVASIRQTTVTNRFVASVLLARSIAITQGTEAIICPSLDDEACSEDGNWGHGWIVIQAEAGDVDGASPSGRVLRVEPAPASVSMHVNRSLFRFRPRGKRATNGTAIVCHPLSARPIAVIVSYNGRPRTSHVLADGSDIECAPP